MTIIEFPENCTVKESSKTFGEQGGTIGRGEENYWVLSDPDCYLSSCHSQISFENGAYLLTDISTNGTFLNGSREPMGNGNKVQLQDGDEVELSDYKFKINLWESKSEPLDTSYSDEPSLDALDPFAAPVLEQGFSHADPFASGEISSIESLVSSSPQETDPLAALDNRRRINDASTFNLDPINSYSDKADVMSQAVDWPKANSDFSGIPENWDDDTSVATLAPDTARAVQSGVASQANTLAESEEKNKLGLDSDYGKIIALQNENIKLRKELNMVNAKLILAKNKKRNTTEKNLLPSNISVDTTMIQAMGLSISNLNKQQVTEINRMAGEIIRETVSGMMQVLTSRNSIKNEFRMNVTTIQPIENNPLKFSANVDDALENMFIKKGSSYKKPLEAIQDGFHGIAEHQIAVLAGIRAAFKGAIERFDPKQLEERFDRQNKGNLDFISGLKKSRNWDQFTYYYSELFDDMDNSFQYLFGDEFVRSYEDQLQRLAIERKTKL